MTKELEMQTQILPKPNEEIIQKCEKNWRVNLPLDYRRFLLESNGGVPSKREFEADGNIRMIESFLCVLENKKDSEFGWYDINVVESQIGERLTDNEDLIGVEILPIAQLFAGDYLCLDYRANKERPSVCIWSHEESGEFDPVTYCVADTFTDFIKMLV